MIPELGQVALVIDCGLPACAFLSASAASGGM